MGNYLACRFVGRIAPRVVACVVFGARQTTPPSITCDLISVVCLSPTTGGGNVDVLGLR